MNLNEETRREAQRLLEEVPYEDVAQSPISMAFPIYLLLHRAISESVSSGRRIDGSILVALAVTSSTTASMINQQSDAKSVKRLVQGACELNLFRTHR